MPQHFQFSQINKKFQFDVNKKLIVQRSELNVSGGRKMYSRIEPKQLRKTVKCKQMRYGLFLINLNGEQFRCVCIYIYISGGPLSALT